MIKGSVEVCNGTARFDVTVQAESIRLAVSSVRGRYPGGDVRVKFPMDPEDFFVEDPAARTGTADLHRPYGMAA